MWSLSYLEGGARFIHLHEDSWLSTSRTQQQTALHNTLSKNKHCLQTFIFNLLTYIDIPAADQTLWSAGADQMLWSADYCSKSSHALAKAGGNIWSVLPKGLGVQLLTFGELCLRGSQLAPTGLYSWLHLTPPCPKINKINKHIYIPVVDKQTFIFPQLTKPIWSAELIKCFGQQTNCSKSNRALANAYLVSLT